MSANRRMMMSAIAAQPPATSLLAYYPLVSNLNNTKISLPAAFERASRKLVHNTTTNLMEWYEEDVPVFQADGVWLEMQSAAEFPHSTTMNTGWTNGEYSSTRTWENIEDETGTTRSVLRATNNTNLISVTRNQGVSPNDYVFGAFIKIPDGSLAESVSLYVYSGSARRALNIDLQTMVATAASSGSLGIVWDVDSYQYEILDNGWLFIKGILNRNASRSMSWSVRCFQGSPNYFNVGGAFLQTDLHGSPILSETTAATRAADTLSTYLPSSDAYCLYAEITAMPRWDIFATPKFALFGDDASSMRFGAAVVHHSSGQAIIRVYYGSSGQYDVPTGYHYDVVLSNQLKIILRVRSTTPAFRQIKVDFYIPYEEEWSTHSSWSGNISADQLYYSSLRWDSRIGVIQADEYSAVVRGRCVKNIKKVSGVAHTCEEIEEMTI